MNPPVFLTFLNGQIGAKAVLAIEAGLYKGTYPSRVEDVKGELIGLSHPLLRGSLLPVLRNVHLKMKMETEGALYQAEVAVSKGLIQDGIPLLWVTPVSDAERVQRRYFVRVPCLLKTGFFRLEGDGAEPEKEEWIFVISKDISLGGVGFTARVEVANRFMEQDRFLVRLAVQEKDLFLTGKVVKKFVKNDLYEMGIAFDAVPAFTEKILGNFIRQQELAGRQ